MDGKIYDHPNMWCSYGREETHEEGTLIIERCDCL